MSLLGSHLGMPMPTIPGVLAQTTYPYYPYYYNQFNLNRNPFFITNPTSTGALSTLANAPLGSTFGFQQISPWFPSIPAIACGAGLFSFNIEGLPDEDVNIPINDEELMALQIQLDKDNRGLFFTSGDDVSGKILVGKDNIKTNQGDDFDVKNLFNNCRTLAFSSTGDVKIKTPLPATPASDKVNNIIVQSPTSATGYPYAYQQPSPLGNCSRLYPDICIPPPPPTLNCGDISARYFRIFGPDVHDFDRDNDGIGCEAGE